MCAWQRKQFTDETDHGGNWWSMGDEQCRSLQISCGSSREQRWSRIARTEWERGIEPHGLLNCSLSWCKNGPPDDAAPVTTVIQVKMVAIGPRVPLVSGALSSTTGKSCPSRFPPCDSSPSAPGASRRGRLQMRVGCQRQKQCSLCSTLAVHTRRKRWDQTGSVGWSVPIGPWWVN